MKTTPNSATSKLALRVSVRPKSAKNASAFFLANLQNLNAIHAGGDFHFNAVANLFTDQSLR